MALFGRAALGVLAAVVIARSSATIIWNTHAPAPTRAVSSSAGIESAVVSNVRGTRVLLRFADGSTKVFDATPAQARMLEQMIGSGIRFRAR